MLWDIQDHFHSEYLSCWLEANFVLSVGTTHGRLHPTLQKIVFWDTSLCLRRQTAQSSVLVNIMWRDLVVLEDSEQDFCVICITYKYSIRNLRDYLLSNLQSSPASKWEDNCALQSRLLKCYFVPVEASEKKLPLSSSHLTLFHKRCPSLNNFVSAVL